MQAAVLHWAEHSLQGVVESGLLWLGLQTQVEGGSLHPAGCIRSVEAGWCSPSSHKMHPLIELRGSSKNSYIDQQAMSTTSQGTSVNI